jgi:tetratricopeptide (TPR) repeat protein
MFRCNYAAAAGRLLFALILLALTLPSAARAQKQGGEDLGEMRQRAADLVKQQKFTEALPVLEKLAAAEPDNAETQFYLGFALIGQANNTKDEAARKTLRVRARTAFVRSKELGITQPIVDGLIQGIPPDGSEPPAFSQNAEADRLMNEAEALFARGKLDDALRNYQAALRLDPKLYMAALFSGDVYKERGDLQQAEVWYQKAIEIDPYRETAYRYSATPLMKQKKYEQARDRYVEAYITEPYNNFSVSGLTQWAQATSTRLGHPAIDIPTDVKFDDKGNAQVNIDFGALAAGKDDGGFAWVGYGAARSLWRKEKFAKTFPQERAYRHSLAEEADALRMVLAAAAGDKKTKTLSPSLARLKKLDEEGLLEAYILLARPDEGIAQDHGAYLRQNRDKLRRYVVQYVLNGGGQ